MANRFPLVIDTTDGNKLKELPAGDNLDLRENSIVRVQDVTALGTINAADIRVNGNRLVAQNFIDLTDTPDDYVDAASKFVKVNETGDGLEFRPFSDIGNIEVERIEVSDIILPTTVGTVDIGSTDTYFNRIVANEFMGDLIGANEERVFNAATSKISYAALEGAPTNVSEFTNDIGYLLVEELDERIAGLFDEGTTFNSDIKGSVFADDSTIIVDGVSGQVIGPVNNSTVDTATLTALTAEITTVVADEYKGPADANNVINAQNDYDIVIGETGTNATIIHNGEADSFSLESGIGIGELNGVTDLIVRAGNRIRIVETPLRFAKYTDVQAAYIVAQNGDVIYNTDQNRFQLYQNNAWVDLHKGDFDGNVTTATGESNFNDVVIAGNLTVSGTTTTVDTANTTITDNVIVLNNGETGAGVTAGTSGIEIDRGSEANVSFVYDDSVDKWTIGTGTLIAGIVEGNIKEARYINGNTSGANLNIEAGTNAGGAGGDLNLRGGTGSGGDGAVNIVGPANITTDLTVTSGTTTVNDLAVNGSATIGGTLTVDGDLNAAAFKGSVFGDDSSVIVDAVNNHLVADKVITPLIEGPSNAVGIAGAIAALGSSHSITASAGPVTITSQGSTVFLTGTGGLYGIKYDDSTTNIDLATTGTTTIQGLASAAINIGTGTSGTVTLGNGSNTIAFTSGTTVDFNGATVNNLTANIDNTTLTVGATDATSITIGNSGSTTTVEGTIQFTNALIANNLTADDSITITTDGNSAGEAISLGPQGSNTAINLTADNIRFYGPITTAINATAGITGDLKGSVVADDSTILIDGVAGTIFKANIEDSANWDTAYSWGDHSTAGYITSGGSFTGDVKGSVFADDSTVMVDAVNFAMVSDTLTLAPLTIEPLNPVSGMMAVADGATWNPTGSGVETLVVYLGGAWRQVQTA